MKINEILTEEKVRLDPKCWKGKKIGNPKTKMKGGVRVNNCVPAEESVQEDLEMETVYVVYVDGKPKVRFTDKQQAVDTYADLRKHFPTKQVEVRPAQHPKNSFTESLTLEEQFDIIEEMVNQLAEANGVDAEMIWEDLESINDDELFEMTEDWQKVNKRDKTDGMSRKAVKAYRRENPGSKLKTAVTTKPSKLKKGSKASKRRKSFCARMSGMKKAHASAKTKRDPDSPINKALRRWNC